MEKGKRDNEGKQRNKEKKKARMGGEERKVGRERDRQDYISLQGTSEKKGLKRTKMKPSVFNFLGSLGSSGIPVKEFQNATEALMLSATEHILCEKSPLPH